MMSISLVILPLLPLLVKAIWPPSYKIHFKHDEVFVISDSDNDADSDEMINKDDIKVFNLKNDDRMYSRLHKLSLNYNKAYSGYNPGLVKKSKEFIPEAVEPQPWKAGIANLRKSLRTNTTGLSKQVEEENYLERKVPRSDESNYDYDALKSEYQTNVEKEEKSKNVLNYTETKEEENVKEVVDVIVHTPKKNCSEEEKKGVGASALRCLFNDLMRPETTQQERSRILRRFKTITIMWVSIYLIIAIPCWCQRGWCCCCFRCKFCKPRQRINRAKKYLADNPLGTYHTERNEVIKYQPTNYEKYAYKNLEKALLKL